MTEAVFIGCVDFSHAALSHLLAETEMRISGVVTRSASAINSDFHGLEEIAREHGVPCFLVEGNDQAAMAGWIRKKRPDVVFCLGWSYLLGREILDIPALGVIGYHPTNLPRNRGRHPIIWTLALGLKETASTFFVMDEGTDSGDIISQVPVTVSTEDDAATLYAKLTDCAMTQLTAIARNLKAGALPRIPQDPARATSWRKRSRKDGEIDWRMPAHAIRNLVRALARPYPGAHCLHGGEEIKIWKARTEQAAETDVEPGKVLRVADGAITVMCGEDAVTLVEHEFDEVPEEGAYL